jgi:hypothetical protein
MPWVSRIGVSVAMWVLRRTFKWFFSPSHAAKVREDFRQWWWHFHQKAADSGNVYEQEVAEGIQAFFSFTHNPDEKAALEAAKTDLTQDPKNKPPNFMD